MDLTVAVGQPPPPLPSSSIDILSSSGDITLTGKRYIELITVKGSARPLKEREREGGGEGVCVCVILKECAFNHQ